MEKIIILTVLRTIAIYILALLLARVMDRKLISRMTFFDFVVGVTMGSISANAILGEKNRTLSAPIALIMMCILSLVIGYLHIKGLKIRKIVNSEPVVVIENGIIIDENMKNIRMTINELLMKLREKNAFNIADVEYAIMETDGQLSVLPKADKRPLAPRDMNIQPTGAELTKDIIIDGHLMEENLPRAGINKEWLEFQLGSQGIKDISEVFYAGIDNSKKLYVSKKNTYKSEPHGKHGIE